MFQIKLVLQSIDLRKRIMDMAFNKNCSFEKFFRLLDLADRVEQRTQRRHKKYCRAFFDKMTDEILEAEFIG